MLGESSPGLSALDGGEGGLTAKPREAALRGDLLVGGAWRVGDDLLALRVVRSGSLERCHGPP